MRIHSFLATAVLLSAGLAAHADTIGVKVSEGVSSSFFDTTKATPFTGNNTASATFNYDNTTAKAAGYILNFSNTAAQNQNGAKGDLNSTFGFSATNMSNYSGSGTVTYNSVQVANYASVSSFLGSSGSAGNPTFGSYYVFDLGNLSGLSALTITHDDGISLYLGNTLIGPASTGTTGNTGATSAVTDTLKLLATGGTNDYTLRYARENGTPSILQVKGIAATPEPSSLALLGTGLLSVAGVVRKRLAA